MRRLSPLSLAIGLVLVVTSLFFGIQGVVVSQSPTPIDRELDLKIFPSGVTPKYVSAGGQVTLVECNFVESIAWNCILPVGVFVLVPPPNLVHIWEVVQAQSSYPVSVDGIPPFVGRWTLPSGGSLPSICVVRKIATATDAWDFRCVLGDSGKFVADFDTAGFIPNVTNPILPESPLLMPTVTPTPPSSQ